MESITLENFRCFREEQTARLAPLTLLVGENSTGKTSFMAMIRALWDIAYQGLIPDFKEDPYDLGSFDEIAHHRGGRGGRADGFDAAFGYAYTGTGAKEVHYRFRVTFGKKGTVPVPMRIRLSSNEDAWIEYQEKDQSQQVGFGTQNGEWQWNVPVATGTFEEAHSISSFFFLLFELRHSTQSRKKDDEIKILSLRGNTQPTDEDWKLFDEIVRRRMPVFGDTAWRPYASAPVRSKPHRTYDPSRPTRDSVGDYIPMYLANVHFQNKQQWRTLKVSLEKFGQSAGLFDEISVKPLGQKESGPFQVQVRKFGGKSMGPHRNLIDVGYGVSQVLPVVTELLRQDSPPMFLLQQPEVHLHPSAQAALGSLFCQTANSECQLVVETHSDHLLDRVRMDVRDGTTKLKPEDVSILFFERGDLDVRIHSLQLDKEGNVLNAPQSYRKFFMEETERSLGLF